MISRIIELDGRFLGEMIGSENRQLASLASIEELIGDLRENLKEYATSALQILNRLPSDSKRMLNKDWIFERFDRLQISNKRRKAKKRWKIIIAGIRKQIREFELLHGFSSRDDIRKRIATIWMHKGKIRSEPGKFLSGDTVGSQYAVSIKFERSLISKLKNQLALTEAKIHSKNPLYISVVERKDTNENQAAYDLSEAVWTDPLKSADR